MQFQNSLFLTTLSTFHVLCAFYVLKRELLQTLDPNTSCGDDGIWTRMLKETALSNTPIVTHLFDISLKLGEIPDDWKIARVSPILKNCSANQNPIQITTGLFPFYLC